MFEEMLGKKGVCIPDQEVSAFPDMKHCWAVQQEEGSTNIHTQIYASPENACSEVGVGIVLDAQLGFSLEHPPMEAVVEIQHTLQKLSAVFSVLHAYGFTHEHTFGIDMHGAYSFQYRHAIPVYSLEEVIRDIVGLL